MPFQPVEMREGFRCQDGPDHQRKQSKVNTSGRDCYYTGQACARISSPHYCAAVLSGSVNWNDGIEVPNPTRYTGIHSTVWVAMRDAVDAVQHHFAGENRRRAVICVIYGM